MGGSGLSAPFRGICVHCCDTSRDTNRDASCARWHECLNHHGVPAAPPRWPLSLGREDGLCASGAAVSGVFAEALIHTNPRRAQKALRGFWWVAWVRTERKRGRQAIAPQPGEDSGGEVLFVAKASGRPLGGPCDSLPLEVGVGGPAAEVAGDSFSLLPDRPSDRPRLKDGRVAPFGRRSRRASVPPLLLSPVRRRRASPRSSGRSGPS